MQIFVPTYGRPYRQKTIFLLSEAKIEHYLVVRKSEAHLYEWAEDDYTHIWAMPPGICNIAGAREYILHSAWEDHICMVDDDVDFLIRRGPLPEVHLRGCTSEETQDMFNLLDQWLHEGFIHCAISQREGNNYTAKDFIAVGRGIRIVAYNRIKVLECGATFTNVDSKEDLDMTLQLLRQGYPNRISYYYAQGQGNSNAPGGCETYRTRDYMRWSSLLLKRLHSDFIQINERITKGSFGGGPRVDVRIYWKSAYEEGLRVRAEQGRRRDLELQESDQGGNSESEQLPERTGKVECSSNSGTSASSSDVERTEDNKSADVSEVQ